MKFNRNLGLFLTAFIFLIGIVSAENYSIDWVKDLGIITLASGETINVSLNFNVSGEFNSGQVNFTHGSESKYANCNLFQTSEQTIPDEINDMNGTLYLNGEETIDYFNESNLIDGDYDTYTTFNNNTNRVDYWDAVKMYNYTIPSWASLENSYLQIKTECGMFNVSTNPSMVRLVDNKVIFAITTTYTTFNNVDRADSYVTYPAPPAGEWGDIYPYGDYNGTMLCESPTITNITDAMIKMRIYDVRMIWISNISENQFTCTIPMLYNDSSGIWNVNATAVNILNETYENSSTFFTLNAFTYEITESPVTSSPIYQAMAVTGAGLAVFIEYLNKGIPMILLGLMLVAIFVIIGSGIKILIKKFSHSHK